jgi:hypothetical protein
VLVGGDGLGDAGVQREGIAEPRDPEGVQDPIGVGHQRERPSAVAELLAAAHQGAQAGRVKEPGAAQVRDDVNGPGVGQVDHPVTELRGGVRVHIALDPQHDAATARGDGLQAKGLHAASVLGSVVLGRPHHEITDDGPRGVTSSVPACGLAGP